MKNVCISGKVVKIFDEEYGAIVQRIDVDDHNVSVVIECRNKNS